MDEELNRYPLELMNDGWNFLCLKHRVGRYVVSAEHPAFRPNKFIQKKGLSALVVAVPESLPHILGVESLVGHEKEEFKLTLERVRHETSEIKRQLEDVGCELEIVEEENATWENVRQKLSRDRHFDIIHFCGHAMFDDEHPDNSVLLLRDAPFTTGDIRGFVEKVTPVFCFVNACQSVNAGFDGQRFNLYGGIGEAFLSSGAYLLASRSKVGDNAAADFAVEFYKTLLGEGKSFGEAVLRGRLACQKAKESAFDWASYIFYGDPRFGFFKASTPGGKTRRRKAPNGD